MSPLLSDPVGAERRLRIGITAWRDLANPLAGGSELYVDRIARGLTARGHDVTLTAGGPTADRAYRVRSGGGTYDQYLRHHVRNAVDRDRFDVQLDVSNGMSFFSPLSTSTPTVCLVHHVHTSMWPMWFPRPIAALGTFLESTVMPAVYRRQLFVAVSNSTREALVDLGVDAERIRIVHNPIDVPLTVGRPSAEPLFVAVGRLVPHKRFDRLLDLWERVRPVTGGRLVIVGDGPLRDELEAAAGDDVTFTGYVSDAERDDWLARASLLVHPAEVEGWGLVVMEAAGHGVPTVAYDVAGVRDSVVDGHTGLLGRDDDEVASNWARLALDPTRRSEMAEAARRRALRFCDDGMVLAMEAVLCEAAGLSPQLDQLLLGQPDAVDGIDLTDAGLALADRR